MQTGALEEKTGKLLELGDMFGDYVVEKLLGKGGMVGCDGTEVAPSQPKYAILCADRGKGNGHE